MRGFILNIVYKTIYDLIIFQKIVDKIKQVLYNKFANRLNRGHDLVKK